MTELITTRSERETIDLGAALAPRLEPNSVVALIGELGTGKTRFAKGVCHGLGVAEHVASPTFTIVSEYPGRDLRVFHFDWYRLGSSAELHELGFEDYLDRGGVCIIEWADRIPDILPPRRYTVRFGYGAGEHERTVEMEYPEEGIR
jgi:tRNA threonylcarbamoyladenosine biosynthesis protein TsaE